MVTDIHLHFLVDISKHALTDIFDLGSSIEQIRTIFFLAKYRLLIKSLKQFTAQTIKLITITYQAKSSANSEAKSTKSS